MPRASVNQIHLYYEEHGPADAPVLVLNNGILMTAALSWIFQTPALAKHYRVLLYDCRGQGQSDHPHEAYSMKQHADDLAALLDHLNIHSAHIAGISYGGEVAQAFALNYPLKTRSLILADTVSEIGPELRLVGESWLDAARAGDAQAFFHVTVPWNFTQAFIAASAPLLEQARQRYQELDFPAVVRLGEAFLKVNFTERLPEIEVPTCIVVGEADLLKGPVYAHILKAGIPHAELHIIPQAGHASCWEKPEEFNSILLGFLAKQTQP